MNERKLTNDEKRDWLLENCVDENGNLVFSGIDLSEFKGKVYLTGWTVGGSVDLAYWNVGGDLDQSFQRVGGDLDQSFQRVGGDLDQSFQRVGGDLDQSFQRVGGDLDQHYQRVGKDLVSQKLKEDEEWVDWRGSDYAVIRTKKLKEISKDELAKMGYKLKEK